MQVHQERWGHAAGSVGVCTHRDLSSRARKGDSGAPHAPEERSGKPHWLRPRHPRRQGLPPRRFSAQEVNREPVLPERVIGR